MLVNTESKPAQEKQEETKRAHTGDVVERKTEKQTSGG